MRHENWPEVLDPLDPFADPPPARRAATAVLHDRRPLPVAPWVPSVEDMLRVATDVAPAAGNDAPDRVLGPWADELDVGDPVHRRLLEVAVAASAFFAPDDDGRTPWFQWSRRDPPPPVDDRAAFRAVERAPWSAWRLVPEDGRWRLEDLVGLGPVYVPQGPVDVDAVSFAPPSAGDLLVARLVRVGTGWVPVLGIVWPGCPSDRLVARWVAGLPADEDLLEDRLRQHGHALVRRCCEWAWCRTRRG